MKGWKGYWIASLIFLALLRIAAAASDPGKDLLEAARRGQLDKVDALLKQGVDVNSADKDGYTPLMRAIFSAKADVVDALIKAGANVNQPNNKGQSAAFLALDNGIGDIKPEIILMLAKAGVDFNKEIVRSEPAIIQAANSLQSKTVRALLQTGVDPNTKSKKGKAVIFYAVEHANMVEGVEMVAGLVSAKADVNVRDDKGRSPLERIAAAGSSEYFDDASVRQNYGAAAYSLVRGGADKNSIDSATKAMVTNGYAYMLEMVSQAEAAGPLAAQANAAAPAATPTSAPSENQEASLTPTKDLSLPVTGLKMKVPDAAIISGMSSSTDEVFVRGTDYMDILRIRPAASGDLSLTATMNRAKANKDFPFQSEILKEGTEKEYTYMYKCNTSTRPLFVLLKVFHVGGKAFVCDGTTYEDEKTSAALKTICDTVTK